MNTRIADIVLQALVLLGDNDTDGLGRPLTNDEATVRTVGLDVARVISDTDNPRALTDAEWFAVRVTVVAYFAGTHGAYADASQTPVQRENRDRAVLTGGSSRDGGLPDDGLADDQCEFAPDANPAEWAAHAAMVTERRNAGVGRTDAIDFSWRGIPERA